MHAYVYLHLNFAKIVFQTVFHSSSYTYFKWECLNLQCNACWKHKTNICLACPRAQLWSDDGSKCLTWEEYKPHDITLSNASGNPTPISLKGAPKKQELHKLFREVTGNNFQFMRVFKHQSKIIFKHHQLEKVQRDNHSHQTALLKFGQLGLDGDYSENLQLLTLWQSQQGFFNQLQITLFVLIAAFVNPKSKKLEICSLGWFTEDLDHTCVSDAHSCNCRCVYFICDRHKLISIHAGTRAILHR